MAFDIDDCFELLLEERDEEFRSERCIRLFQFQTWIWYPGQNGIAPRDAGRIAASAFLRNIEQEQSWRGKQAWGGSRQITLEKLQTLSQLPEYRAIFTEFISSGGGWSRLLFTTPGPAEFDKRIKRRTNQAPTIAELIEYRLRASVHPPLAGLDRSKITHAIFFRWWPNKKLVTARTLFARWQRLSRSAAFIYLVQRRRFPFKPPSVEDDFLKHLIHPKVSGVKLKRFFSEYEFISDQLGDDNFYSLPIVVKPVRLEVRPFSDDELAIIRAYDENYMEMNEGGVDSDHGEGASTVPA
jgi:hypothetical protein